MANETGEIPTSPEIQELMEEFTDFIRSSIKNEAKLKIQPITGKDSACLLVSTIPNKQDTTLEVNHATALAVFDAQDLAELDKAEDLTPEEMDVKNTAALMAGRIMERTAPKSS